MELRLDRLLDNLRRNTATILQAIDRDPQLLKRAVGSLVIANASQALYTPQEEHQLYAKGIVYERAPYRLVSLPLIKIYNLGERDVGIGELAGLANKPNVSLRFLRKIDGSLIQVFRHDGRVWFTTRGSIEGALPRLGPNVREGEDDFDYLGTARRLAAERYPRLFDDAEVFAERTLIFELIHPRAKKVTNYGDRAELTLIACFQQDRLSYATYPQLVSFVESWGLTVVDAIEPAGTTLAEQIRALMATLEGTDQEGSVLQFENSDEVLYRVKVKSPDYLRLMRAIADCTYENLVALLNAHPRATTWADVEAILQARGREEMPEEILPLYRRHYEHFTAYLADCERLCQWALRQCDAIQRQLGGGCDDNPADYRKRFAAVAKSHPLSALLFSALDGRLDLARMRRLVRNPEEASEALREVVFISSPQL